MKKAILLIGTLAALSLWLPWESAGKKLYNPNLLAELGLVRSVEASYVPSAIKSITQIQITTTGTGSQTQTVSVTKANSLLTFNGTLETAHFSEAHAYAVITNGTTITATSVNAGGTWYGTLTEFYGLFVKSEGCATPTIAAASTSATSTISPAVVTAKTRVAYTGLSNSGGNDSADDYAIGAATLTSTTQATVNIAAVSTNALTYTVGYCYLEFR